MNLVLTNEPKLINEVENLGKFETSDHSLLYWKINVGREETSMKVIRFDYNKMDLNGIREELRICNWDEVMLIRVGPCLREGYWIYSIRMCRKLGYRERNGGKNLANA